MSAPSTELPVGMAGLRYGITQVSLAVRDLDSTMALYHRAFGWAPWQVFDHVPAGAPPHRAARAAGPLRAAGRGGLRRVAQLRAAAAARRAEPVVRVHGPARRRVASIATMFLEREDGDAVKRRSRTRFDIDVIMKAEHRRPHRVLLPRHRGAVRLPDRVRQRPRHRLRQAGPDLSASRRRARSLAGQRHHLPDHPGLGDRPRPRVTKMRNYHEAFGWGPWKILRPDGERR